MKLQEIFNQLTAGEYAQLNIGGAGQGVINDSNYEVVLPHINLALGVLFRRFLLKEGRITVALQPDQQVYRLNSQFAVNGKRSKEPVRYLIDTAAEPFLDDILKIERVLTSGGFPLAINVEDDVCSVATPNMTSLVVPLSIVNQDLSLPDLLKTDTLSVVYRAGHRQLSVDMSGFDPDRLEVELPQTHLDALLYFVASRVHNPIGMTNEMGAATNYYARFEAACEDLKNGGMQVNQTSKPDLLHDRGFV